MKSWEHESNELPDWLARMATDANREAAAAGPTAKRGRLSDRMWADVRVAARIARDENVTVRVHGVLVGRPNRSLMKTHEHEVRQKPAAQAGASRFSLAARPRAFPRP